MQLIKDGISILLLTAKKIDQTFVQEMKNMLVTSIKSDPDCKFITDDLEMNKILEKYK